jgi:NADPH:quinone reductase-like Zn-dependent oxidoreductase
MKQTKSETHFSSTRITMEHLNLNRRNSLQAIAVASLSTAIAATAANTAANAQGSATAAQQVRRESMRAYTLRAAGAAGLQATTLAVPQPKAKEVLIRVRAVSLNAQDRMVLDGVINPGYPRIPASDGAGEVVAIGSEVTQLKVGDRVTSHFLQHYQGGDLTPDKASATTGVGVDGMLAEYAVLPEWAAIRFPKHLNFEEASTLPIAALTAYHSLVVSGARAGESVLLVGTGVVSLFALQFAKVMGLRVFITSGSDEKLAQAKKLGADELINRKTNPEWDKVVLERTGGQGVDIVFDTVGARNYPQSANALKLAGFLVGIGVLGVSKEPIPDISFSLLGKRLRYQGMNVGSRDLYERMNALIAQHNIKPVIDRKFAFSDAAKAYEYYAKADNFGKVIITI